MADSEGNRHQSEQPEPHGQPEEFDFPQEFAPAEPLDEVQFFDPESLDDASDVTDLPLEAMGVSFDQSGTGMVEEATVAAAPEGEVPVAEAVTAEDLTEETAEPEGKKPGFSIPYGDWIGLGVAVVAIVGLTYWKTDSWLLHALYLIALTAIPFALWKSRSRWMSPELSESYTVLLGLTIGAMVTGTYLVGLELAAYDWDRKAQSKPMATNSPPLPPSPILAPLPPRAGAEQPAAEKPAAEKRVVEKPAAEKPAIGKPEAETPMIGPPPAPVIGAPPAPAIAPPPAPKL